MVEIVRRGEVEKMQKMMEMGLSPNPCNVYGESLVHMVRTREDFECQKPFFEFLKPFDPLPPLYNKLLGIVLISHHHDLFLIPFQPTHEQVCRRGDIDLLEVLVDAGANLQVSDDYGRTGTSNRHDLRFQINRITSHISNPPKFCTMPVGQRSLPLTSWIFY